MNKKLAAIIILIGIFLFPMNTLAICNNSEKARLSSLVSNVSITYDYVEENGQVSFYITFTNLQPEFYVKDVNNKQVHYFNSQEMTLYGYKPNRTYRFDFYSTNCGEKIKSQYITTPGYNPYYNDPVCIGVTDSICQKWVKLNYDYDTFVQEVNKLKKGQIEIEQQQEEIPKGFYDYILDFYKKYYFIILPIIIITGIIIIVKQRKKDTLF